jgi:hypothetical protein
MEAERSPVTLEQVRVRFLEAEEQLRQLASALSGAQSAAAELGAARTSIDGAAESVSSAATKVGAVADVFADHDASLRKAIELLAAADPRAIREELTLLQTIATESRDATAAYSRSATEGFRATQALLGRLGQRVWLAIAAAIAALLVSSVTLVLTLT